CGGGSAVSDFGMVVRGGEGTAARAELRPGQRFTLAVPADPAPGDDWELVAVPDTTVASFISEEQQGGTTYFVFNAKRPGSAEIRLRAAAPATGEAVFDVTVKQPSRTHR
ncbi:hypothetical protein C1J01_45000, partial [Nonomuraea aridisoli]